MRSAETSGVEARGFGASDTGRAAWGAAVRLLATRVSALTIAVAFTTLVGASLFVALDALRVLAAAQAAPATSSRNVAVAEPVALWRDSGFVAQAALPDARVTTALDDVLRRGVGAFGLAFLCIGATMVRRRPARARVPAMAPYHSILGTLPFGAACWTAEGRLIACNAQFLACLHMSSNELRPGASYSASVKRLTEGGYTKFISDDETSRLLELHRQDGSCLMIDERPLADGGFVTLVTDVTESRRTDHLLNSIREEQRQLARRYHEEKLKAEAANRSKTSFLAHLSHDIRTPLNAIIGFAEMMRQQTYGPLGDRRYAGYVEDMKASGERLLTFFARVLELVELENGEKPLKAEPFQMDDMLHAVARRFAAQAQRAGIQLSVSPHGGGRLVGDRFALERMTGNIVENALRHTPAGGRVNLAVYAGTDGVVIEISDTGSGMSEERLQMLSQPFAFGDAALTRQHSGAGLGIAIARAIAELSGGHLAIDSRPTLGTTVAISLPLPLADASSAQAAA